MRKFWTVIWWASFTCLIIGFILWARDYKDSTLITWTGSIGMIISYLGMSVSKRK